MTSSLPLSKKTLDVLRFIQKKYNRPSKLNVLQLPGSAGKYAEKLFRAAHEQKLLETIEKDSNAILNLTKRPPIRDFFARPTFTRQEQKKQIETFEKIFRGLGVSPSMYRFVATLIATGKTNKLIPILANFNVILKDHRGERDGVVTTAAPMPKDKIREIAEGIQKNFLKPSEKINLVNKVDPSIQDGSILFFSLGGSEVRYYDMSLRTMERKKKAAIVHRIQTHFSRARQNLLDANEKKRKEILADLEKEKKEAAEKILQTNQAELDRILADIQARRAREDAEDSANPPKLPDVTGIMEEGYRRLVSEGRIKPLTSTHAAKKGHH